MINNKMDIAEAKKHMEFDDDHGVSRLHEVFREKVEQIKDKYYLDEATPGHLFSELFDVSNAFIILRDAISKEDVPNDPPLIIFTDASLREDMETAAFSIIARDLNQDFILPINVLEKYQITLIPGQYDQLCVMSGEIVNFDVHATEMMAVVAGLDIFSYSMNDRQRPIVFYTDSLITKKVLGDKRLPPNSKKYSEIRKYFMKLISDRSLDVVIKKVKAHSGIEMNEIADQVAKKRLFR